MPIFDQETTRMIRTWNQDQEQDVNLKLILADLPENEQFISIGNELENIAEKLTLTQTKKENTLPGFGLNENIVFSALPLQKELKPFLGALSQISTNVTTLSREIKDKLDEIKMPVSLKLYIALACPHCPAMVETAIPLALYCKNIHLEIIDGSLFTQKAQQDKVMSAPCLILDDDFRWSQYVESMEIVKMITGRDPSQLGAQTLKIILEDGDAQWLVDQMINKGSVFENFYKLIFHETWSVRLGAMVVVEELCAKAPELSSTMCPVLIESFNSHDITVQGDILYALGESGSGKTQSWINEILPSLTNQELIDAAEDALESIESRI